MTCSRICEPEALYTSRIGLESHRLHSLRVRSFRPDSRPYIDLCLGSYLWPYITTTSGRPRTFHSLVYISVQWQNIGTNSPQLSQLLFYENGTQYDQTLILNSNYEVDPALLAEQGLPYYSSTWVVLLLSQNLASSPNVSKTLRTDGLKF